MTFIKLEPELDAETKFKLLQRWPREGRGGDSAAQHLALALEGQQAAQGRYLQRQESDPCQEVSRQLSSKTGVSTATRDSK